MLALVSILSTNPLANVSIKQPKYPSFALEETFAICMRNFKKTKNYKPLLIFKDGWKWRLTYNFAFLGTNIKTLICHLKTLYTIRRNLRKGERVPIFDLNLLNFSFKICECYNRLHFVKFYKTCVWIYHYLVQNWRANYFAAPKFSRL